MISAIDRCKRKKKDKTEERLVREVPENKKKIE